MWGFFLIHFCAALPWSVCLSSVNNVCNIIDQDSTLPAGAFQFSWPLCLSACSEALTERPQRTRVLFNRPPKWPLKHCEDPLGYKIHIYLYFIINPPPRIQYVPSKHTHLDFNRPFMTPHHVPRSGEMKPCLCILSSSLLPGYSVTDWKGVRRGCINDHVQLVNPRWERSSRRENDSDLIAQWNTNHGSLVVATWQLRCLCVTLPGCLLKSVRWVCGDNDNVKSLAIRFVLPAACEVKSLCFLRTSVVRRWHSDSLTLLFIQELDRANV